MDETGWRLRGQKRALWGAFTSRHAVLRIKADRHEDHARELLGDSGAIVTSDPLWAYKHLPLARRQVCWAHLRRDFLAHAERLASENEFGEHGLRVCDELFWSWEIYQHTHERKELKRRIRLLRRGLKPILRQYSGKAPRYKYTRGLARNLLKVWPALWTFLPHPPRIPRRPARRHRPRPRTTSRIPDSRPSAALAQRAPYEQDGDDQGRDASGQRQRRGEQTESDLCGIHVETWRV
jgi:transposase